jgi:predicted methyltransferase
MTLYQRKPNGETDAIMRNRDPNQKPAEVLMFVGVKPGDRVADFWPAPPYSTRLLSKVVGHSGHVYAILPEKLVREVPAAEDDTRKPAN